MTDLPRVAWSNPEALRLHCIVMAIGACCGQPEAVIPLAEEIQGFLRPPRRKRATKPESALAPAGNVISLGRKPA